MIIIKKMFYFKDILFSYRGFLTFAATAEEFRESDHLPPNTNG